MRRVFVAGAGMTRIGRRSEPLPALMADAARIALADAGLEEPEAIVVATMNPEEFVGDGNFASNVATHMGFSDVPALRIETATSSGAAAFYMGFAQIAAGLRRTWRRRRSRRSSAGPSIPTSACTAPRCRRSPASSPAR